MVWEVVAEKDPEKDKELPRNFGEYMQEQVKRGLLDAKKRRIAKVTWGAKGKDAYVVVRDLLEICEGARRTGRIPDVAIDGMSKLIKDFQHHLDSGNKIAADIDEELLKQISAKWELGEAIMPQDVPMGVAIPPEWAMRYRGQNTEPLNAGEKSEKKEPSGNADTQ